MSDNLRAAIAELQEKLAQQERESIKTKEMINQLCFFVGDPPLYRDAQLAPTGATTSVAPDEYYGKPLATAVTMILKRRKVTGQSAAKAREIFNALVAGGYDFQTKNDANAIRGLRISLAKNTAKFHKLPTGHFGLASWYPSARKQRGKSNVDVEETENDVARQESEDHEGSKAGNGGDED